MIETKLKGNQAATTSAASIRFVKIIHSSHPFYGQKLELLSITTDPDKSIIVQLPTGSRAVIPVGWTDYSESADSTPSSEGSHLLDVGGLCEVIEIIGAMRAEGRFPYTSFDEV